MLKFWPSRTLLPIWEPDGACCIRVSTNYPAPLYTCGPLDVTPFQCHGTKSRNECVRHKHIFCSRYANLCWRCDAHRAVCDLCINWELGCNYTARLLCPLEEIIKTRALLRRCSSLHKKVFNLRRIETKNGHIVIKDPIIEYLNQVYWNLFKSTLELSSLVERSQPEDNAHVFKSQNARKHSGEIYNRCLIRFESYRFQPSPRIW